MNEKSEEDVSAPGHSIGRSEHLVAQIVAAQEDERARIARDLHDDICQQISVLAMELQDLHARISEPAERKCVDSALEKLARINTDLHRVSHRLHPSIVSDLGLRPAIEAECRDFADRFGIPVHFEVRSPLGELPAGHGLALFRVAQEALHNVARHARASKVNVSLDRCKSSICLRIEDSGVGFDTTQPPTGLGLTSMRERIALVDGSLIIHSAPGCGTTIMATVSTGPTPNSVFSPMPL